MEKQGVGRWVLRVCSWILLLIVVFAVVVVVRALYPDQVAYVRVEAENVSSSLLTEQSLTEEIALSNELLYAMVDANAMGCTIQSAEQEEALHRWTAKVGYTLRDGRLARLERSVRRWLGGDFWDVRLEASQSDSLRIRYCVMDRIDTLDRGVCTIVEDSLQQAMIPIGWTVGLTLAEATDPLVGVYMCEKSRQWNEMAGANYSCLRAIRLREMAEERMEEIDRFMEEGSASRRAWGNLMLGTIYERLGCMWSGDTVALRSAEECYRQAVKGAPSELQIPIEERITWIGDYIEHYRKTNDTDAFIASFQDEQIRLPDSCRQLILVYNDRPDRVLCQFRRYEKDEKGRWFEAAPVIHSNVGRAGIAPFGEKREGDMRTPSGAYPMGFAFGYEADIELQWPYVVVTPEHYWISDSEDPLYNQMTTQKPQTDNFEYLRRDDDAYKYAAVVEYNMRPIEKYKGSAIFFHVESGYDRGSAGCITVPEEDVVEVLQWLDPKKSPYMLIRTQPSEESGQM